VQTVKRRGCKAVLASHVLTTMVLDSLDVLAGHAETYCWAWYVIQRPG